MQKPLHLQWQFPLLITLLLLLHLLAFSFVRTPEGPLGPALYNQLKLGLVSLPFCFLLAAADATLLHLTRRWYPQASHARHIALDGLLTTLFSIVVFYLGLYTARQAGAFSGSLTSILPLPVAVFNLTIVFMLEALYAQRQRHEAESRISTLQREKAEHQLQTLKNQMNPHFLFNSLNALASLTRQDGERANHFVKRLAVVYRYLLTTQQQPLVPLADELAFVQAFFDLEHLRLGDSLSLHLSGTEYSAQWRVVPTSLQTAVENAIKHNVCTQRQPLAIRIDITPARIQVSNPLQLRASVSSSNGIGLINLQRQCQLQGQHLSWSADSHTFTVEYH